MSLHHPLLEAAMVETIISSDHALFLILNRTLHHPLLDFFFTLITDARFWILPAIVAASLLLKADWRRGLTVLLLAIVTVTITDQLAAFHLKPLFQRLRPCNPEALMEGGRFLLGFKGSFSFPSNHAANVFGQAMLFSLLYPRRKVVFWWFLIAGSVAYSRVYVGVHFPLDVTAGALFGSACGAAVWLAYRGVVSFRRGDVRPSR